VARALIDPPECHRVFSGIKIIKCKIQNKVAPVLLNRNFQQIENVFLAAQQIKHIEFCPFAPFLPQR
jgi:hypothetical protein